MTRRAARMALAGAAAWASVAGSARAQDTHHDDTSDLRALLEESVVSTASKALETASVAPSMSTVITAEDLRRHGIHTLDEAINYLSTAMIVEGSQVDLEIGARGVLITGDHGVHMLLLVNGHTMNEQWGGTAYFERGTGIPFELIDHIEVIVGPGSVLYGSNAMLGVINLVTKRAKDWSGVHLVAESELPTSFRALAGVGREFHVFGSKGEVTGAVEYYGRSGPTFTLGPQPIGDGAPYSADSRGTLGTWGGYPATKANYSVIPSTYLRVMLGDFEVNARAAAWKRQVPWSYGPYDDPNGYELESWMSLDVRHRAVLSSWIELTSRAYADSYSYTQILDQPNAASDCPGSEPNGCKYELRGTARWGGLEEQLTLDWSRDGKYPTLVGVDARLKDVRMRTDYYDSITGANPSPAGIYPCANAADPRGVPCSALGKQLAAYAEQKARPHPRIGLSAGVRLDVDDAYGARASPRVAAAVQTWTGGSVKAIYSEAFRAPTIYERFYTDITGEIAAPNLKPETVRSIEAAIEHKQGSQRLLVSAFRSWWYDLVSTPQLSAQQVTAAINSGQLEPGTTTAYQSQNITQLDSYGATLAFEGTQVTGRLRYGLSFTTAYARELGGGMAPAVLPAAAQAFGNARASFEIGGPWPTIGLVARYASPRLAANASPALTAPATGSMRLALSGKVPVVRGLTYLLSGDYSFSGFAPYATGPGNLPSGLAELTPIQRFTGVVQLAYTLDP